MMRAKSDFGPRLQRQQSADSSYEASSADGNFKIRHGWDDQLNSDEYNQYLASVRFPQDSRRASDILTLYG